MEDLRKSIYNIALEMFPKEEITDSSTDNKVFIRDNVAVEDDKGFCVNVSLVNDSLKLNNLYVMKKNRGYGTRIMKKLIEFCKDNKIRTIIITGVKEETQSYYINKFGAVIDNIDVDNIRKLKIFIKI